MTTDAPLICHHCWGKSPTHSEPCVHTMQIVHHFQHKLGELEKELDLVKGVAARREDVMHNLELKLLSANGKVFAYIEGVRTALRHLSSDYRLLVNAYNDECVRKAIDALITAAKKADMPPAPPSSAADICKGCGKEVDLETCWCGMPTKQHGNPMDAGHPPIPSGCDCYRS